MKKKIIIALSIFFGTILIFAVVIGFRWIFPIHINETYELQVWTLYERNSHHYVNPDEDTDTISITWDFAMRKTLLGNFCRYDGTVTIGDHIYDLNAKTYPDSLYPFPDIFLFRYDEQTNTRYTYTTVIDLSGDAFPPLAIIENTNVRQPNAPVIQTRLFCETVPKNFLPGPNDTFSDK